MTNIPENTVSQEDLNKWYTTQAELKALKISEMLLRQKIFKFYFPVPAEGTNTAPLAEGWVLKGTYPITREIDDGALGAMKQTLADAGIRADDLVKYKASLVAAEYKTLTAEQTQLFDQCLIIKPGSPALGIVLPAKAKKAGKTT
jgi:hypothetical protein